MAVFMSSDAHALCSHLQQTVVLVIGTLPVSTFLRLSNTFEHFRAVVEGDAETWRAIPAASASLLKKIKHGVSRVPVNYQLDVGQIHAHTERYRSTHYTHGS